jgi:hypothetical protein
MARSGSLRHHARNLTHRILVADHRQPLAASCGYIDSALDWSVVPNYGDTALN